MPAEERCIRCRYCRCHVTLTAAIVGGWHLDFSCDKDVIMSFDECPLFTPSEDEK